MLVASLQATADLVTRSEPLVIFAAFRSLRIVQIIIWARVLIPPDTLRSLHTLGGEGTVELALGISAAAVGFCSLVGLELFSQPEGDFANFAVSFQVYCCDVC